MKRPARRTSTVAAVLGALSASIGLGIALALGGGAAPLLLGDPGLLVRWGLPALGVVVNIGQALALAGALFVAFILPVGGAASRRARTMLTIGAWAWAGGAALSLPLAFWNAFGMRGAATEALMDLADFAVSTTVGQAWLVSALTGACVAAMSRRLDRPSRTLAIGVLVIGTQLVQAHAGHAQQAAFHSEAVEAVWLHTVFASVWLGGVAMLIAVAPVAPRRALAGLLTRFSPWAATALAVVATSGLVSAAVRVPWSAWTSSGYGFLLLTKAGVLVALGVAGALFRLLVIRRVDRPRGRRLFWLLALIEVSLMGLASGVAVALAATPPPTPADASTPSSTVGATGWPAPPEGSWIEWLSAWRFSFTSMLVCAALASVLIAAVISAVRRGSTVPVGASALWSFGVAILFWTTNGPLHAYAYYSVAANAAGLVCVILVVPGILATAWRRGAGLPGVSRARTDGSWGVVEWRDALARAFRRYDTYVPAGRLGSVSVVAVVVTLGLAATPWVLYLTPVLEWTLADHLGRLLTLWGTFALGLAFVMLQRYGQRRLLSGIGPAVVGSSMLALSGALAILRPRLGADWFALLDPADGFGTPDDVIQAASIFAWTGLLVALSSLWGARRRSERGLPRSDRIATRNRPTFPGALSAQEPTTPRSDAGGLADLPR